MLSLRDLGFVLRRSMCAKDHGLLPTNQRGRKNGSRGSCGVLYIPSQFSNIRTIYLKALKVIFSSVIMASLGILSKINSREQRRQHQQQKTHVDNEIKLTFVPSSVLEWDVNCSITMSSAKRGQYFNNHRRSFCLGRHAESNRRVPSYISPLFQSES